jgi:hypothetical protein
MFLKKSLINTLQLPEDKTEVLFSGRVAINLLAKTLRKDGRVLMPDYLCNVVEKAFLLENYEILKYSLDELFEPNETEVLKILRTQKIDVVLFASIYGSGQFLTRLHNPSDTLNKEINRRNISVIIDLAQDLFLTPITKIENRNYHYVFSFNDKSIRGIMGSLLVSHLSKHIIYPQQQLSLQQNLKLILDWLKKGIKGLIGYYPKSQKLKFDHSVCRVFPFEYINYKPSIIQVLIALLGTKYMPIYKNRKMNFLKRNKQHVLMTFYCITTPYLVFKNDLLLNRKTKSPYAVNNIPYMSLKPNLKIFHNKGFDDRTQNSPNPNL